MASNTQVNQILFSGDAVTSYLALAGATCMIYDHLTTLDIEIEVVWNRPKWQIPQVLFFLNRYVGLILQIYTASFFIKHLLGQSMERYNCTPTPMLALLGTCSQEILADVDLGDTFNLVSGSLAAVTFSAMHGIMVYRVSSMYTHDPKIMRILVTAYATEFVSLTIIQLLSRIYGSDIANSDIFVQAPIGFCAEEKYTSWIFTIWIPLVLFESLICGLALALGIKYYRAAGSRGMFSDYRNCNRKTPLLYILLRDSIIFPFIFSLICVFNLVTLRLAAMGLKHAIVHACFVFPVVSSVILGSRLILNLQESYYEPCDQEFSIHMDTLMDSESN